MFAPVEPRVVPASASSVVTYSDAEAESACAQTVTTTSGAVLVSLIEISSKNYCVLDFKNNSNSGTRSSTTVDGVATYTSSTPIFSWSPPTGVTQVDYFMVAGGGGGLAGYSNNSPSYAWGGGGGGAGGVRSGSNLVVSGSVSIAVGAGRPLSGTHSAISTTGAANTQHETWDIFATGGGRGGSSGNTNPIGLYGGSGGGGTFGDASNGVAAPNEGI